MQVTPTRLITTCARRLPSRSIPLLRPLPFSRLSPSPLPLRSPTLRSLSTTPYHSEAPPSTGTPIGRIDRRLRIIFTCTAPTPVDPQQTHPGAPAQPCGHRSSHEFSKRSYEKGVVIVQCPECSNRHLIGEFHLFATLFSSSFAS